MGNLTSIYNFVPLNEQVFYPSWADQVSQDAPFTDGEDGFIDVTLHNVSPLFTRNGSADRNNPDPHSAHVMVDGKRLYFLPATSIKGMLRATLEIMSFGKMTQYTNRFFSKRELGGKHTPDGDAYVDLMKGVKPAWLRMQDGKLYLTPCDGYWQRFSDAEIASKYPSFRKAKWGYARNKAIAEDAKEEWFPIYNLNGKDYRIVCTGDINNKTKEYLFPIGRRDEVPVGDRVKEAFFLVHEPSPDFGKITEHLKSGKELAVFYLPGKTPYDIKAIGLSAMLRYPYKQSIDNVVKAQQKNLDENKHDLAEVIFGYTTKDDTGSLRGRVQVGNAFATKPLSDDELKAEVTGVLGQPKPSFYPFYVKQTVNPYKTYDNADGIAGRKLYRVHRGSTVTDLPQGNDNENNKVKFIPIPENQTFRLCIAVHNLRKMEMGALLSALTLHKTKGAWHNIGLARGFGYGKLEIDGIKLSGGFSFSVDEYLKEFERQMSIFTYSELPSKVMWTRTEQIAMLVGILGEHDDEDMRVMEINSKVYGKEYVEAKRNFDKLTERTVPVPTLLSENDREEIKALSTAYRKALDAQKREEMKLQWRAAHKADYEEAQALVSAGQYDEAYSKYEALAHELQIAGLNTDDEELEMHKVREAQNAEIERRQQEEQALQQQALKQKLEAGLGAELEEKYAEGTKAGQYKVADFKVMNNKTDQWMKKTKETALTDKEKEDYAATFSRLSQPGCHPRKEEKDLINKSSRLWQKAKDKLGDRFDELLGGLYNELTR